MYSQNTLGKGYRLGVESSSDHYLTHEFYTMLLASETLPPDGCVPQAPPLCGQGKILADVRCGTRPMGKEFTASSRRRSK